MPILAVWTKTKTSEALSRVNTKALSHLLCPYQGEIFVETIPGGLLATSELASHSSEILIPKDTRKASNTAWLSVKIESESIRFETDPLGTFPLWIYEDNDVLIVTSEVKSLSSVAGREKDVLWKEGLNKTGEKLPKDFSPYANVKRLVPGAHLTVGYPSLELTVEERNVLNFAPTNLFTTTEEARESLYKALIKSASEFQPADEKWGTFLSGGIDSGITTALLQRQNPKLHTLTLGTEFGNEFEAAGELARHLHLTQDQLTCDQTSAKYHFNKAVVASETWDGLTSETLAQLSFLARESATKVKHVATGYGSDLLFGSMLSHKLYLELTGVKDLQSLIERTAWTGEFCPFFAWSQGISLHHLFWHPEVMNQAFRIPQWMNDEGPKDKEVLRRLAVTGGYMDEVHAYRTKQALTDGTQFNRCLSLAFNLESNHAYEEKGAIALSLLKDAIAHG